jgi:hypothetical protein
MAAWLEPITPSSFNSTTTIRYSLSTGSETDLTIYDLRGRVVRTLVTGQQEGGGTKEHFESTNLIRVG